jgi:hypothetical protein
VGVSVFAVCRSNDDGSTSALQAVWISSAGSNNGFGIIMSGTGKDRLVWTATVGGTPTADNLTTAGTAATASWRFIAATTDGTNYALYDKTAGAVITKTNANARILATAPTLVGNYYASSRQGTSEQAMAGVYNRGLTSAEVETIYQYAKGYMARRSITI